MSEIVYILGDVVQLILGHCFSSNHSLNAISTASIKQGLLEPVGKRCTKAKRQGKLVTKFCSGKPYTEKFS